MNALPDILFHPKASNGDGDAAMNWGRKSNVLFCIEIANCSLVRGGMHLDVYGSTLVSVSQDTHRIYAYIVDRSTIISFIALLRTPTLLQ